MNAWTFTGRVITTESHTSASGPRRLVITLRSIQGATVDRCAVCRFNYWHDSSCPPEGALCMASGHFARSRDRKEADRLELTASELHVVQWPPPPGHIPAAGRPRANAPVEKPA